MKHHLQPDVVSTKHDKAHLNKSPVTMYTKIVGARLYSKTKAFDYFAKSGFELVITEVKQIFPEIDSHNNWCYCTNNYRAPDKQVRCIFKAVSPLKAIPNGRERTER